MGDGYILARLLCWLPLIFLVSWLVSWVVIAFLVAFWPFVLGGIALFIGVVLLVAKTV